MIGQPAACAYRVRSGTPRVSHSNTNSPTFAPCERGLLVFTCACSGRGDESREIDSSQDSFATSTTVIAHLPVGLTGFKGAIVGLSNCDPSAGNGVRWRKV
ncbi:MAG: hypothetical protein KDB01_25320 [Planctomycetaceae bacterium]|nr:hypothetical protein [Planctomycetaceae bacterium]